MRKHELLAAEFSKKVGNSAFCGCGGKFCWLIRKCFLGNSELGNDQWEGMTKLRRELQGGIGFADGRLLIAGYLEDLWAERLGKEGFGFAELLARLSSQRGWEEEGFSPLFVGWDVGCLLWMGGLRKMERTSVSIGQLLIARGAEGWRWAEL